MLCRLSPAGGARGPLPAALSWATPAPRPSPSSGARARRWWAPRRPPGRRGCHALGGCQTAGECLRPSEMSLRTDGSSPGITRIGWTRGPGAPALHRGGRGCGCARRRTSAANSARSLSSGGAPGSPKGACGMSATGGWNARWRPRGSSSTSPCSGSRGGSSGGRAPRICSLPRRRTMRMLLAVLATGYALCRHREVRQHGVSVTVSAILDGCSFQVTVRSVSDRILQLAFQVVTYVRT